MDSPTALDSKKPAPSVEGDEETYETGEDDDDTLSFLDEIDSVRGDIKQKSKIAANRPRLGGSGTFGADVPIPLSEDDKTALAIGVSIASIPGAYDGDNNRITRKLTEAQIQEIRRLRVIQKSRRNFQQPDRGVEECDPDTVDPIDELQANMQGYDAYVVDENAKAEQVKELKLKKRRKILIAIVVAVVSIVCIVAGVLVGRGSASDGASGSSDGAVDGIELSSVPSAAPSFDAFATICAESTSDDAHILSDRYLQFRSAVGSSFPDMTIAIDTPMSIERVSLCWLADIDTFQSTGEDEVIQRFILALIYFRFVDPGGDIQMADTDVLELSQSWLTNERACDWDFLDCNSNGEVQGIQLRTAGLVGRIPTELSLLTTLLYLDMSNNALSGELPSELWDMTQLETLRLGFNQVSGTLPVELNQLQTLIDLQLDNNKFIGTLPPLASLSYLKDLNVGENALEGVIPDLSALTNLGKDALKYIAL